MATPAGEFNKRLRLETPAAMNRRGRSKGTPVVVATVWAKVETLGGNALEAALQTYDGAQVRVTVRNRQVLHGQHFVYVESGQVLEVGHVDDPGFAHRETVCLCSMIGGSASPVEG